MSSKRDLMQYYKRKLYNGRGWFSRAVDYIAIRIMVFMACYMWFSVLVANQVARMLFSLTATAFISVSLDLINSFRLDKFIAKQRSIAAEEGLAKKLTYLTDRERMELIREYVKSCPEKFSKDHLICAAHRSSGVSVEDVVSALRSARERKANQVYIFHTGTVSSEAAASASTFPEISVSFVDMRSTLSPEKLSQFTPGSEEIDRMLTSAALMDKQRLRPAISAPFSRGRAHRYLLAALCLAALSFAVDYAMYYRLMAGACLMFGVMAWWLNRAGRANS